MDKYEYNYNGILNGMSKMNSRLRRPSKEYKDVYESLRQIVAMQDQAFSPISPQMLEAQEKLSKACETYMVSHAGERKTDRGKERFNLIERLNGVNNNRYAETAAKAEEIYGRDPVVWTKIAPIRFLDKMAPEKKGINFAHAAEVELYGPDMSPDKEKEEYDINTFGDVILSPALENDPEFKQMVEKSREIKAGEIDWNQVKHEASDEFRAKYEEMRAAAPKKPSESYKEVMKSLAQMVYITNGPSDLKSPEVVQAHEDLAKACENYMGKDKKLAVLVNDVKNMNHNFKNPMEGKRPGMRVAEKEALTYEKLLNKLNAEERKKGGAKAEKKQPDKKQENKKQADKKQESKKQESKKQENKKQENKKSAEKKAAGMGK